MSVYNDIN